MTRRPRTAAMLTVTAMAGVALSLALAPASLAADSPTLGAVTFSPEAPAIGDTLHVHGEGCVGLPTGSPSADPGAAVDPDAPAAPAAFVAAGASTASVSIEVTGPDGFDSNDTATPSVDGSWDGSGIVVAGAGDYTINSGCTLVAGGVTLPYPAATFTVEAAPVTPTPAVTCFGCDSVMPGGSITVGGNGFAPGASVDMTLTGYAPMSATADSGGALTSMDFVIRADQAAGALSLVVSGGGLAVPTTFTVTVAAAVPTADPTPTPTPTATGDDDPVDTGGGVTPTRATPSLPATGVDSTVPGILGASLLVAGVGLVWAGRRRPVGPARDA